MGTVQGALALTAQFASSPAGASVADTPTSIGATELDSTVIQEKGSEEKKPAENSFLTERLAELDDSAAAFRPTRTLARD